MTQPPASTPKSGPASARTALGGWLEGPRIESGAGQESGYRGERLGLPESGPGSLAPQGRRLGALIVDWIIAELIAVAFGWHAGTAAGTWGTLAIFGAEQLLLRAEDRERDPRARRRPRVPPEGDRDQLRDDPVHDEGAEPAPLRRERARTRLRQPEPLPAVAGLLPRARLDARSLQPSAEGRAGGGGSGFGRGRRRLCHGSTVALRNIPARARADGRPAAPPARDDHRITRRRPPDTPISRSSPSGTSRVTWRKQKGHGREIASTYCSEPRAWCTSVALGGSCRAVWGPARDSPSRKTTQPAPTFGRSPGPARPVTPRVEEEE